MRVQMNFRIVFLFVQKRPWDFDRDCLALRVPSGRPEPAKPEQVGVCACAR